MPHSITAIPSALPLKLGTVNSYLVKTDDCFVLIDSGCRHARQRLMQQLRKAGCQPGNLKLILLTHGDFDHSGNAAYLREVFGTSIAMHHADHIMVEKADMYANRHAPNFLIRKLTPVLMGFRKEDRFYADVFLKEGASLAEYGIPATVFSLPGHSAGSLGILLEDGDFFCGDLLENEKSPALGSIIDEISQAHASLERLHSFSIRTVYPGHGVPFAFSALTN